MVAATKAADVVIQPPAATLCDCQAGCDVARQLAAAHTHSNCAASRHTCKALGPCSSTTGHVSSSGVTPGPSSPPPAPPLLADKAASSTGPHPAGSGTAQPQSCRLASPQG